MNEPAHNQGRALCLLAGLLLFACNLFLVRGLFQFEYIDQMGSVDGSFIAFARYIRENWGDLTWFPLWFAGMPVEQVYQPGLHYTVALASALFHCSPARAYHVLAAVFYASGPVTVLWMTWRLARSWPRAAMAGALYSFISPSIFLFDNVRRDAGSLLAMRRLQNLVQYGDGPHVAALALLPVALISIDWAARSGKPWRVAIPSIVCAGLVLTNWPGAIGLAIAVLAYSIAFIDRQIWVRLALITVVTTVLVLDVIPFDIAKNTVTQAQTSNGYFPIGIAQLSFIISMIAGLFMARRLGSKLASFRIFMVLFALATSAVTLSFHWFGFAILPQPYRFQQEWEIAIILLIAVWLPVRALPLVLALLMPFVWHINRQGGELIRPVAIERTFEYRFAHWVAANLPDERVFAPGSATLWMNVWTNVPQFAGCCDAAIPTWIHRVALYTIYRGENAGDLDAQASIAWLRAYGVQAIGVSGPNGREAYKPFAHPTKFDGVLPLLWEEGGDKLYRVPGSGLAHAMRREDLVNRTPAHGLDLAPLQPYLRALDSREPSGFKWLNRHEARIQSTLEAGDVISVQISFHPRWKATVDGKSVQTRADGLGLLVVEPNCAGECLVSLRY